jgi:exodeoxyribonuclease VII large subunit
MLKPYFENSTGQALRAGLNVLVAVQVEFNGVYGFSLNVRDIDPTFTIGELAARRMKIIRQLEEDGIVNMNKELEMPKRPQRIAIISSATAAGYGDFMDQLKNDEHHFAFYTHLFQAVMQGDQAESSIIAALDKIYKHVELFDTVIIIRGGGATTDLACFDNYLLALNCAQYPLPILTGIGHQRDNTIVDMVAHLSLKTPTAVAEYLIQCMQQSENEVTDVFFEIINHIKEKLNSENQYLTTIRWKIRQSLQSRLTTKQILLEKQKTRLRLSVRSLLNHNANKLSLINKSIETHSPAFLLKHGYTITSINGKRITSIKNIKKGDKIRTFVHDGDFDSIVN